MCSDTAQWIHTGARGSGNSSLKFHARFLFLFLCVLSFFPHRRVSFCHFVLSFLDKVLLCWHRYCHPQPNALKLLKPPLENTLTSMPTRTWHNLTTGKALSQNRQENSGKPGYNLALMEPKRFPPGRWAPSYWEKPKDRQRKLHPGKCLCSTLGSLAFLPRKWVIIRLLLTSEKEGGWWREGDSFHH